MAYNAKEKQKPAANEESKGKRPDFVIRARQVEGSDFFVTVGAAWEVEVNGQKAYSIKLTAVPINWNGSCLMLAPKEE